MTSCTVMIDGTEYSALAGQSIAAVMIANNRWWFRTNPAGGTPRGAFCGMGICFECELQVDGVAGVRACVADVREGMTIRTMLPP